MPGISKIGTHNQGFDVFSISLESDILQAEILNFGATLKDLRFNGFENSIVLGYNSLQDYFSDKNYLGVIIGRYANRISNGQYFFESKEFELDKNEFSTTLHGGSQSCHNAPWKIENYDDDFVELSYQFNDGDMGFVFENLHGKHRQSPLWSHLNKHTAAIGVHRFDLFGPFHRGSHLRGEFLKDGKPLAQSRVVKNPREFAGYSFAYNHTLFARRVHDVMTVLAWVCGFESEKPEHIRVEADVDIAPVALAALAVAGEGVNEAAVGVGRFAFVNLKSYRDPNFLPGAVKYGDIKALRRLATAQGIQFVKGAK